MSFIRLAKVGCELDSMSPKYPIYVETNVGTFLILDCCYSVYFGLQYIWAGCCVQSLSISRRYYGTLTTINILGLLAVAAEYIYNTFTFHLLTLAGSIQNWVTGWSRVTGVYYSCWWCLSGRWFVNKDSQTVDHGTGVDLCRSSTCAPRRSVYTIAQNNSAGELEFRIFCSSLRCCIQWH